MLVTYAKKVDLKVLNRAVEPATRDSWSRIAAPRKYRKAVIQKAYIKGISSRSVDELVEAKGMCALLNYAKGGPLSQSR
jgi:transposase-like protein